MYKQNGIRLCGDAADVGEADVAGDPFGAEFVEIAGENPYADHNLLIRGRRYPDSAMAARSVARRIRSRSVISILLYTIFS